ncbi:hypothetical protein [Azonexus sp.]|uniref:hypothetical protein n=1 Tax=Azonexus sp. TaxID=1872668 RepID=UPI0027B90291|nr:hypothetical protein [Azonexus sp.]
MKIHEILLCTPERTTKVGLWLIAIMLVGSIGYLHLLAGPAYEFQLFFMLPIALVAWFVSTRRAYVLSLLTAVLWYLADRQLGGDQPDRIVLLFNMATRLGLFISLVWLLGYVRGMIMCQKPFSHPNESRQARAQEQ